MKSSHIASYRRRLTGAALIALATAPAALHAQQQTATPPADTGVEDIIVTAQRREERLQNVPISVTAVTANALANSGVNATNDLPQIAPSVNFTRSGPSGLFFIRGVGTTNAAAGEEGANAVYIDGVYMPDLAQSINNFNNIERLEVLKGPQGTLFGRNATGGLINIITREPGQDFVAKGQVGYANYKTVNGQLYLASPLTERISADIALTGLNQDKGWGYNFTRNDQNKLGWYWGARSKLVWRATDDVKVTLAGDYNKSKDNWAIGWRLGDGLVGSGGTLPTTGQNTTSNQPAYTRLLTWGGSLTVEADLGFATLTNVAALRRNRVNSFFDVDGAQIELATIGFVSKTQSFQEEIRLASNGSGPFNWQVGAFYLNVRNTNEQQQRGGAFAALAAGKGGFNNFADMKTNSYAVFGELGYDITPTTHLIGGVRYTKDKRKFTATSTGLTLAGAPEFTLTSPSAAVPPSIEYSEVTYRAAIRQDLTERINVYASFNHGFKAGSYNLQAPTSPPVNPQYIDAYEVGFKSELFRRALRLNISAFHYNIADYQVRSAAVANPGSNILLNAASVKVDGIDVEFDAAPTRDWRLFGGFSILDSKFAYFGPTANSLGAPFVYPRPAACTGPITNPGQPTTGTVGGLLTCFGDASGRPTPLSPKFTASFGSSWTIPVGEQGKVRLSGLFAYNSGYNFEFDGFLRQGDFTTLNGSIEYRPTENWGIELWGRNLTDTTYFAQQISTATGATYTQAAPLQYGVNLKFDF